MNKKVIYFLSVGRSDFARYYSILTALKKYKNIHSKILVTGAHFDEEFGNTYKEIKLKKLDFVKLKLSKDYSKNFSFQNNIINISATLTNYLKRKKPDILILSGDRYEMLAGSISSIGLGIPIIHIHGGAVTEGAIDELVRHAITKMSHYHYVIHKDYRKRLLQMGEESWRIKNFGAPGLDKIYDFSSKKVAKFERENDLKIPNDFCLACYHPVTLELSDLKKQIRSFLKALGKAEKSIIFTYPNADPGTLTIIKEIKKFKIKKGLDKIIIKNAGSEIYNYFMSKAQFMVGNSSSGIVEAASFKLPVINIGSRQNGKVHPENVINVNCSEASITKGIKKSQTLKFWNKIKKMQNPYGNGSAGRKIAKSISELDIKNPKILRKKFINYDIS